MWHHSTFLIDVDEKMIKMLVVMMLVITALLFILGKTLEG